MSRWFRALTLTLALAALSLFAASCGSNSPAQVRFVHAIQDGAAMDIDINGAPVFTNISFLGVLPNQPGYTTVTSGHDTIEGFLAPGETTVGFNPTSVGWSAGAQYTVVATGLVANGNNAVILSLPDNNTAPSSGYIEFRVIHASPSGPPVVDVYIDMNPSSGIELPVTIKGLAYTQASSYIALPFNPNNDPTAPGFTVYVTASGTLTPVYIDEQVNPGSAGEIRTLVLTDVKDGTQMNSSLLELSDVD
jgi:hypothetical protein